MFKSVTVINEKNEKLDLVLMRPELSGLAVLDISGLGFPDTDINVAQFSSIDGGVFSSSRMSSRNIVFSLAMYACEKNNFSIENARMISYRFFPVKKKVRLVFETDNRHAEISGYVEKNEPDIFSDKESTQVSIICPDPYFYEVGNKTKTFAGIDPLFEFPFSNESLTDPLIEMGEIKTDTRAILNYEGDSDTGMTVVIHAKGEVKRIVLFNVETSERFSINADIIKKITGIPFGPGDDLVVSTVKGNKYVRLLRNGFYSNMISAVERGSSWLQISPGNNLFGFTSDPGINSITIELKYRNAYGGI